MRICSPITDDFKRFSALHPQVPASVVDTLAAEPDPSGAATAWLQAAFGTEALLVRLATKQLRM